MHFEFSVSTEAADPAWDEFLHETPHGYHTQSSSWGQLKTLHNWKPLRLIARKDGQIVAGIQILLKSLPVFGSIGYACRGPVFRTHDDGELQKQFVAQLHQLSRSHRILVLFVEPARDDDDFVQHLLQSGFRLNQPNISLNATVLIDLEPGLDEIMGRLKKRKRYSIRYGQRNGICIREGHGNGDVALFYRLLSATAERQGFPPFSLEYFEKMHELFEPNGHLRILFAEHDNEALSAVLLIPYGDSVSAKHGGWTGEKGNLRPNEALEWAAIEWSKAQGYRYYDLEGIDRSAAIAVLAGEALPDEVADTFSDYKLSYGGQVKLLPQTYSYIRNPLIAWLYYTVYPRIANSGLYDSVVRIFRGRSAAKAEEQPAGG